MREITIETHTHREFVDVTARVQATVRASGVAEGICLVFSPHTTAAVTINENADPDVVSDLLQAYVDLLGDEDRFRHAEGNSGGHALTSLVGPSVALPVQQGRLALGVRPKRLKARTVWRPNSRLTDCSRGAAKKAATMRRAAPLERWQAIYLCEFDGPRQRTLQVQVLGDRVEREAST